MLRYLPDAGVLPTAAWSGCLLRLLVWMGCVARLQHCMILFAGSRCVDGMRPAACLLPSALRLHFSGPAAPVCLLCSACWCHWVRGGPAWYIAACLHTCRSVHPGKTPVPVAGPFCLIFCCSYLPHMFFYTCPLHCITIPCSLCSAILACIILPSVPHGVGLLPTCCGGADSVLCLRWEGSFYLGGYCYCSVLVAFPVPETYLGPCTIHYRPSWVLPALLLRWRTLCLNLLVYLPEILRCRICLLLRSLRLRDVLFAFCLPLPATQEGLPIICNL